MKSPASSACRRSVASSRHRLPGRSAERSTVHGLSPRGANGVAVTLVSLWLVALVLLLPMPAGAQVEAAQGEAAQGEAAQGDVAQGDAGAVEQGDPAHGAAWQGAVEPGSGMQSSGSGASVAEDGSNNEVLTRLLELTNEVRRGSGLAQLEIEEGLAAAASSHAREMARLNYFSHTSPTPERATLAQRLSIAGVPSTNYGENLAWLSGVSDIAATAVQSWLDSPGHRAALLNPDFTHVGFGVAVGAGGDVFIAQVFASEARRLMGVSMQPSAAGVSLVLTYETGELPLALFVNGQHVPSAFTEDGRVAVTLAADEPTELAVGELEGVVVTPFHTFTLVPGREFPELLAGSPPH